MKLPLPKGGSDFNLPGKTESQTQRMVALIETTVSALCDRPFDAERFRAIVREALWEAFILGEEPERLRNQKKRAAKERFVTYPKHRRT